MAVTETRPGEGAAPGAQETAPAGAAGPADHPEALIDSGSLDTGGLAGLLGTGSHLAIGRLWLGAGLLFLVVTGVIGGLLGIESIDTDTYDVLDADTFAQTFSFHGVTGVFLVALPLLIGVATAVVPAQIGAPTVAFPRAAAAAFWGWLIGSGLVVAGYLLDGGPGGEDRTGTDLFLTGLSLTVAALVLACICLATTVLALRPLGLRLERVPAFAWSVMVFATIQIVSLGLLVGLLVLLYLDSRYRILDLTEERRLDEWLRWTMMQPQIFAAAIPALGFAADVIPVGSGVRQRRHGVMLGAIAAFGAFSFGAWTFFQFRNSDTAAAAFGTEPTNPELAEQALYVAFGFAIVVPVLMLVGGLLDTMRRGKLRPSSPLLWAWVALLGVLAAVVAGALRVVEGFELFGTTADAAVAHLSLGAGVAAVIGAVHYWWPQLVTRPLSEIAGALTGLLALGGVVALGVSELIAGFLDQSRGSLGTMRDNVETLNAIAVAGGGLVLLAVLLFLGNLFGALAARGRPTETDPWDGFTLEWAADPTGVDVHSAAPLLDAKIAADAATSGEEV